ncbi:MAG: hypothetical protein HY319_31275 [Armatimonadetes bacterium]|nr:hypothetical protein [Armatimonadota bacterium]
MHFLLFRILLLALAAFLTIALPSRAEDEPEDPLKNLVLKYEGASLQPVLPNLRPVGIAVRTFADVREDQKIVGRSATYSIFHIKGTGEQYDTPADFLDFIARAYATDLERLGFTPRLGSDQDVPDGATSCAADAVRVRARGERSEPVDSGLVLTGEVRRFYGEVVTNTWAWPFVGQTAQGEVKLCVRVLDSATGEVLAEQTAEGNSEVGGGEDRVNGELNTAFIKAVQASWAPAVQELLAARGRTALERQQSAERQASEELQRLAAAPISEILPAVDYAGISAADLKVAQPDGQWVAGVEAAVLRYFGGSLQPDDGCLRISRSCSFSLQQPKTAGARALLVTLVSGDATLEGFEDALRDRALPWTALQQPSYSRYGIAVSQLKDARRLVVLVLEGEPADASAPASP